MKINEGEDEKTGKKNPREKDNSMQGFLGMMQGIMAEHWFKNNPECLFKDCGKCDRKICKIAG